MPVFEKGRTLLERGKVSPDLKAVVNSSKSSGISIKMPVREE